METKNENIDKYKILMKLYDQADVINDIVDEEYYCSVRSGEWQ